LRLYEISGSASCLHDAISWSEQVENQFADKKQGGYFQSAANSNDLVVRGKPVTDGAVPSGNGIMVQNLARLYALTGDTRYQTRAETTLACFGGRLLDARAAAWRRNAAKPGPDRYFGPHWQCRFI
jgi:uncharacterized protein YyaL (SSP411 family)